MASPPLAGANVQSISGSLGNFQIGSIVAANPSMYTITANPAVAGISFGKTLASTVKNMRTHLFKVEIGEYDSTLVTAMIRSINFHDNDIHITFLLDDADTIRQAFAEYHSFRLSYLDSSGTPVETYEISSDPLQELKIVLPNVGHDLGDMPNWKIILKNYTTYKVT
jgi:hypothetical protein